MQNSSARNFTRQNPSQVLNYQAGGYYRPASYRVPASTVRADVNFRPVPSTAALMSTTAMYGGCIPLPK